MSDLIFNSNTKTPNTELVDIDRDTGKKNFIPLSKKKANVVIRFRKRKLGMWVTDSYMVDKAKRLKALLDKKTKE